jgi:hypothetical protein
MIRGTNTYDSYQCIVYYILHLHTKWKRKGNERKGNERRENEEK